MSVTVKSERREDLAKQDSLSDVQLSEKDLEALAIFKDALEMEGHGKMADAIELYRKAFRLNEKVDLLYRQVVIPTKIQEMKQNQGKNSVVKIDEEKMKAIDVEKLLQSFEHVEARAPGADDINGEGLTIKFANLGLDNHEEVVTKPISPLVNLHHDIWLYVFEILLITNPDSWINLSITCKKFAYIGLSSNDIWRKLCYLVYPLQVYEENQMYIESNQTVGSNIQDKDLPIPKDQLLILPSYKSWRHMMNERPFIKFNGCYISVINYYSEGGNTVFSNRWTNPIRIITYYRYLRFYPDGTCVKVLSTLEPFRVVPQLLKYNLLKNITSVIDQVKDAAHQNTVKEHHRIYHGNWTVLTSGEVHITINEGSVPYYQFHYHFQIKSMSKVFKFNKLSWIKYFTIRKQMSETDDDDRIGEVSELTIRNEKPFKFLKVKSYDVNSW